jgi:FtsZ-binding cell division protein ZapB
MFAVYWHLCCVLLQIDAIKAASVERQAQLDRETAELKQQQDDLTAKLKDFQRRVRSFSMLGKMHCLCSSSSSSSISSNRMY